MPPPPASPATPDPAGRGTGNRADTPGPFFKVPAGVAPDGRLVRARNADAGTAYRCPGCDSPLVLKKGDVRTVHFAHRSHAFCSPETALHLGVKQWIASLLEGRLRNSRRGVPRMRVPCGGGQRWQHQGITHQCPGDAWLHLADLEFDEVALEQTTPDGLKPDVLLLHQGQPALGIEVLVTHAVDPIKSARSTHPWVELEARQVIRAPRRWQPRQSRHPWMGVCRTCQWADHILACPPPDDCDPGEYAAQLSASFFAASIHDRLQSGAGRQKPAVTWRCPWCRKRNARPILWQRLASAALASSLIPPCEPEVVLGTRGGPSISVRFGFPRNLARPWQVIPLEAPPGPALRATPQLKQPHRLILNGTNRPLAFLCQACGRDCVGALPFPGTPISFWSALSQSM